MTNVKWAAATALGLLAIAGCSTSSAPAVQTLPTAQPLPSVSSSPASVGPSPEPDAKSTAAAAAAAALEAYRGFRRVQVAAEAVANPSDPDLATYAGDRALAQERGTLFEFARNKIVVTGRPTFRPQVYEVSLTDKPVVTITDCVVNGTWKPVFRDSGKSAAAPNQPATVPVTAVMRTYNKRWIVVALSSDMSRPC